MAGQLPGNNALGTLGKTLKDKYRTWDSCIANTTETAADTGNIPGTGNFPGLGGNG